MRCAYLRRCPPIVILLCLVELDAAAQIAVEVQEGQPTVQAAAVIAQLRSAFARYEVKTRPADVRSMLRNIPKPGITDALLTYAEFVEKSDRVFKAFMTGDVREWPKRRSEFEALLAEAYANPAVIAVAEGSRELMTRTYAALALCRVRLNDKAGGLAALAEQLRSYPDLPLTRGPFGTELTDYYNETRAAEGKKLLGAFVVEVDEPSAQIYINESLRGQAGRFSGDVFAGAYRVMIRVGSESLRYEVVVEAGASAKLALEWKLERALIVSSERVGLRSFPNAVDAEQLARVQALARKLGGVSSIVVFHADALHATAALYDGLASGAPIGKLARRGRVALRGNASDRERFDALAVFVMKGTPSREVVDTTAVRRAEPRARPQPAATGRVEMHRERDVVPLALVGAGAAAVIVGGALYALDEDAQHDLTEERRYRDLAPLGVALGSGGLIAVGIGAYLWTRGSHVTPTIALGPSSAMIGWAGSF